MNHPHPFDTISESAPRRGYLTEKQCFSRIGISYLAPSIITLMVMFMSGRIFLMFSPDLLSNDIVLNAVYMVAMYLVGVPVAVLLLQRVPARAPQPVRLSPRLFFVCLVIAIAFITLGSAIGNGVMSGIDAIFGTSNVNDLETLADDTGPVIWGILILIAAPVLEELLFRKLLLDRIRQFGEAPAILLSGILFGLYHGNFYQFFYAALVGFVLAYLYLRTGRLRNCILLHLCVNLIGSVITPALANPSSWLPSFPGSGLISSLISIGTEALLFGCVLAGILLLFANRSKLVLRSPECVLSQGYLRTAFVNAGMILFLLFMTGEFLLGIIW